MSKVQITPTSTKAVNPIRIHCSDVRCFRLISKLTSTQFDEFERTSALSISACAPSAVDALIALSLF
jgi:hypothetical protein